MRRGVRRTRVGCAFHRWYTPSTGRYTRPDPLARQIADRARYLRGTPDPIYGYADANPVMLVDPLGLAVQVCQRPNEIPELEGVFLLDDLPHKWIKTDDKEAGLGEAGGVIPGNELPDNAQCRCQRTEIVDHSGQSTQPGATCRTVPLVDEDCVNRLLQVGQPRGNWMPLVNDCFAFVDAVITQCRDNPGRPKYRQSPL